MVKIELVETKKQKKLFIDILYKINQSDKNWVPPLRFTEKRNMDVNIHPFYKKVKARFYLAKINGKIVGRIASIFNKESNKGYFGFLQAMEDQEIFDSLFEQVEKDLCSYGVEFFIGPVSPSINYEMGVLVDGFDSSPFLMLPHNHSYYDKLIKTSGFEKVKDFHSFYITREKLIIPEKIKKVKEIVKSRLDIKIRNPDMNSFSKEIKIIESIINSSMKSHWGFEAMSLEEIEYMANDLIRVIDPKMVFIAEVNNEPVGFIMFLPNFNEVLKKIKNGKLFPIGILKYLYYKNKVKGLRLITLGVKKAYQPLGIGSLLYFESIQNFLKSNYVNVEFSWVMEDNHQVNKISELFGAKKYKTYRLYRKSIKSQALI